MNYKSIKKIDYGFVCDFEVDASKGVNFFYLENIINSKIKYSGENINIFFNYIIENIKSKQVILYFHNLNYDGFYIINYLLKNNYNFTKNKSIKNNEFISYIDNLNNIYNIKIKIKNKYIYIYDSYKIIKKSVEELAKNTSYNKIKIDFNNINYDDLKNRCINDVRIVKSYLVKIIKKYGIYSTASSYAFNTFFNNYLKEDKNYVYPELKKEDYYYIKNSVIGGYCYINNNFLSKKLDNINVYDVNSLYPYILYNFSLPYGLPAHFKGKYKQDLIYNKYIQHIKVDFKLKNGGYAFITTKNLYFEEYNYIKNTYGELIDLYLTDIDLQLLFKNYDVKEIYYIDGLKFTSSNDFFKNYIKDFYNLKVKAKKKNKKVEQDIYKIFLNSLYGRFGIKIDFVQKIPYINKNNILSFKNDTEIRQGKGVYIPLTSFVNSYGRLILINEMQNYKNVVYADTDSIHLYNEKMEERKINNYKLGYFKKEEQEAKAIYLKTKVYILQSKNGEIKKVIAGANEEVKKNINFDNFKIGGSYDGNLKPVKTKNSIILKKEKFRIK